MSERRGDVQRALWLLGVLAVALLALLVVWSLVPMAMPIGTMPAEMPMQQAAMGPCMALMTVSTLIVSLIAVVVAVLLLRSLLPWDRPIEALEIARSRYARGEFTREEYERLRQDLRDA